MQTDVRTVQDSSRGCWQGNSSRGCWQGRIGKFFPGAVCLLVVFLVYLCFTCRADVIPIFLVTVDIFGVDPLLGCRWCHIFSGSSMPCWTSSSCYTHPIHREEYYSQGESFWSFKILHPSVLVEKNIQLCRAAAKSCFTRVQLLSSVAVRWDYIMYTIIMLGLYFFIKLYVMQMKIELEKWRIRSETMDIQQLLLVCLEMVTDDII